MNWKFWSRDKLLEKRFIIAIVLSLIVGLFSFILFNYYPLNKNIEFGVTFSKKYAEELGLDWQRVYLDILDDLKVRAIRLPIYWDDVEKEIGQYDWSAYDWMIDEAEKRNVQVILNIGIKLPRWPECHTPSWTAKYPSLGVESLFLPFLRDVVERYKNSPAIWAYQIENEPYFFRSFGICPDLSEDFLKSEIELVKQIGGRSIILTESGELGHWERMIGKADILGVSLYRITWNRWVGYFFYPLTPVFYREKINVLKPFFEDIIVTELQVEPWAHKSLTQIPLKEQFKTMDLGQLRSNIDFVRRVGVDKAYVWGVEWWWWMKERGHNEFWNEGKRLFH